MGYEKRILILPYITQNWIPQAMAEHRNTNQSHFTLTQIRSNKQEKAMHTKFYLSAHERKELLRDCGDTGLLAMEWMLRLAALPVSSNPVINDDTLAEYFDWSKRKAGDVRRDLIKHGYLHTEIVTQSNNTKMAVYYVGKQAVEDFKTLGQIQDTHATYKVKP